MALLAVLQPDPRTLARLQDAVGREHDLLTCSSWENLWEVAHRQALDGCILDIYHPDEPVSLRQLQGLRRRQPPVAIVVYGDFRGRELDLFELGRLEIDGVILAEALESARETRAAITHALGAAVALRVITALTGRAPPLVLDLLRWGVEHAHEKPRVDDLGEAFALSGRALARELRERGLPSPSRILLWARLFRGAHMLDSSDRTVEDVAFTLGYASPTSLARAFRRETGHPPTGVLKRGGVACVLEAFMKERADEAPGRARRWSRARGRLELVAGG